MENMIKETLDQLGNMLVSGVESGNYESKGSSVYIVDFTIGGCDFALWVANGREYAGLHSSCSDNLGQGMVFPFSAESAGRLYDVLIKHRPQAPTKAEKIKELRDKIKQLEDE